MSKRTHAEALHTKSNILEAAQKIFSDKGFTKASLSDIAREAGVTRGAIYWHFENKTELLAALMEEEARKLNLVTTLRAAANENQRDPLGMLRNWALMHFSEDAKVFFNSSVMAIFESVIHTDIQIDAREKLEDLIRSRILLITDAVRNAIAQKQLPNDTDPELAASYIQATLMGLVLEIRQGFNHHPMAFYHHIVNLTFSHLPDIKRHNPLYRY